jgi:L-lactate utilization protein LutB
VRGGAIGRLVSAKATVLIPRWAFGDGDIRFNAALAGAWCVWFRSLCVVCGWCSCACVARLTLSNAIKQTRKATHKHKHTNTNKHKHKHKHKHTKNKKQKTKNKKQKTKNKKQKTKNKKQKTKTKTKTPKAAR